MNLIIGYIVISSILLFAWLDDVINFSVIIFWPLYLIKYLLKELFKLLFTDWK